MSELYDLSHALLLSYTRNLNIFSNLSKIFLLDNKTENLTLSNEDKVKLIMIGLDKNVDKRAGPWELLKWIEWVEEMFQGVSI